MFGRRVVITGVGLVTPLGIGVEKTWEALLAGRSGAGPITQFDATENRCRIACEVKGWDPEAVGIDPRDAKKMDRFSQFALAAADEAMRMSGLDVGDGNRVGCVIGSGIGGMIVYEEQHTTLMNKGARRVSPFFIPMMIGDMAAGLVSIRLGLRGPNYCTVSACASGAHAIADSAMLIATGQADAMMCGGTEATITPMAVSGFANMKAMSTRNDEPELASRPFDKGRDGFVIGEGCGLLILESYEGAKARGADILCEVVGFGLTGDAYHMTAPHPEGEGAVRAMRAALDMADMKPEDIDYINAHGTSTPLNDKGEVLAVKSVFGPHAYELKMGSTKSMTGHLLGAAAGIETVFSALAIARSVVPPTINRTDPDPDCDLDHVTDGAVSETVSGVLSNSFGFGGHNVSLILRACD